MISDNSLHADLSWHLLLSLSSHIVNAQFDLFYVFLPEVPGVGPSRNEQRPNGKTVESPQDQHVKQIETRMQV